ncbi:hypothetical protein MNBD_PLANCTO02-3307 [hydrothermal vent metagenome]|uniref:Uncharacterized protein n=1 Tax=hydrothermal vent metagenome TaxID=652676 RepID=A0A3B1DV31_9ZZZZ
MKKEVTRFVCPECSTTLRMKKQSFINRPFHCPECQEALKITINDRNIMQIQRDDSSLPAASKKRKSNSTATSNIRLKIQQLLQSPQAIAGGVVMVIVLTFSVWFFSKPSISIPPTTPPTVAPIKNDNIEIVLPVKTKVKPALPPVKTLSPVIARKPQPFPVIAKRPQPSLPEIPLPPKPKPIDIAAKLNQQFLQFNQSKPIGFQEFLFQFEELLGVPVEVDQSIKKGSASPLKKTLSFQMKKGTLNDLLKTALSQFDLTYKIEPTQIRILKKKVMN